MLVNAEHLISEAYNAIVSGDDFDMAFGNTRAIWFIKVNADGTTSLIA